MVRRPTMQVRDRQALVEAMRVAGHDTVTLGVAVGKSKQFIACLCRGAKTGCKPETAQAISAALGLSTDHLFSSPLLSEDSHTPREAKMSAPPVLEDQDYLLFDEVAEFTRIKPATLRWMRHNGEGPPFFRVGRRLTARREAVQTWMREQELASQQA